MRRSVVFGLGCSILVGSLVGCGASHTAAWDVKSPAASPVAAAADPATPLKEGDDHWAKRDDRAELEAAIAAWDKAAQAKPDGDTYSKLARAVYLLADGHLAFEAQEHKDDKAAFEKYLKAHERGMEYGERALVAYNPEFKKLVESGKSLFDSIGALDKNAVPALYWYTSNLGKWASAQGFTTVLKFKNKIKKNIERCLALDEHFFNSAPHRYLGVIYAKAPAIAGGDMKQAKVHFDASMANSPNYMATHVLWAEYYATKASDKEGFKRELELVIKAADDVLPDLVAETKVEKKKAQKLLALIEEKF